ncbi:MAG TPA: PASTA domain-containing protein [Chitinophagaceae bacterium]|nr:PASTA domain-containing protein [Chitinophagaceae bacterium]
MFKRLTRQPFWVNLLAAIGLIFLIWMIFFISLGFITKHGQSVGVPLIVGRSLDDAEMVLNKDGFHVVVQDSAFTDSLPAFTILRQSPQADDQVKPNRTVFLTVNKAEPPMTAMPDLISYSFRSAVMTLESQRLVMGDTIYRADFAKNSVLDQLYQGKPIKAGTLIPEGSRISLVLANGLGAASSPVPDFIGLTFQQARDLINADDLSLGVVLFNGPITDTANAYVFQQIPARRGDQGNPNNIHPGEVVDLWVSQLPQAPDSSAAKPPGQ